MRRNRKKMDRLWIGLLVGFILPVIMWMVFFSVNKFTFSNFSTLINYLSKDTYTMTQLFMVCILPNTLLVFFSYKVELWDTFKGVMIMTMLYMAVGFFMLF